MTGLVILTEVSARRFGTFGLEVAFSEVFACTVVGALVSALSKVLVTFAIWELGPNYVTINKLPFSHTYFKIYDLQLNK